MAATASNDAPLNQQIESAKLELQALNDLVAEVPDLMEARFRRELAHHLAMNHRLTLERSELAALVRSMNNTVIARTSGPKLPAFMQNASLHFRFAQSKTLLRNRVCNPWSFVNRSLRWWILASSSIAICCLALALLGSKTNQLRIQGPRGSSSVDRNLVAAGAVKKSSILSHSIAATSDSLVELWTTDSTWVEVSDRDGRILLHDTLHAGDQRRIRFRTGLEIYAARPEQLRFRVDDGPWQPVPDAFLTSGLILLTPESR